MNEELSKEKDLKKYNNKKNISNIIIVICVLIFGITLIKINENKDPKENPKEETKVEKLDFCSNNGSEYAVIFETFSEEKIEKVSLSYYSENTDSLPKPTKKGFKFAGWYYDEEYKKSTKAKTFKDLPQEKRKDTTGCVYSIADVKLYAKWKIDQELSDEMLYTELNILMKQREYNEYAIKLIDSIIKDYQKLFTNEEIYELFQKVKKIRLNPYDPANPDLSQNNRAYNSNGDIVINCFKGELEEGNVDGLKWLLTHEIMHSLGDFSQENIKDNFNERISIRNAILEEGLADSIADMVKGVDTPSSFAIKKQKKFEMYRIDENSNVIEDDIITHTYTIGKNFINLFKYVGCYDSLIDSQKGDFSDLKRCMKKNVKNGEEYYNELFSLMDKIFLYIRYPDYIYTQEEVIEEYKDSDNKELIKFIKESNLNDLFIEYAELSETIINNKLDNSYSAIEYYNKNIILYNKDNKGYKTNLKYK